jgi:hypothetical protein
LLCVLQVEVGTQPGIAVMKLEREQGIRFKIEVTDGRVAVDLQLLRDLTLTNKTKVFKTALLIVPDPTQPITMTGRVSDNQRGRIDGRGVADFFLGTF